MSGPPCFASLARPTFAVAYDRSFNSTEEVDDFLANSEEREVVETVYPFL